MVSVFPIFNSPQSSSLYKFLIYVFYILIFKYAHKKSFIMKFKKLFINKKKFYIIT